MRVLSRTIHNCSEGVAQCLGSGVPGGFQGAEAPPRFLLEVGQASAPKNGIGKGKGKDKLGFV